MKSRVCPRCGNTYSEYPALSRKDNETEICLACGVDEALEGLQASLQDVVDILKEN